MDNIAFFILFYRLLLVLKSHPHHSGNNLHGMYSNHWLVQSLLVSTWTRSEMRLVLNWNWNMIFTSNTKCAYIIFTQEHALLVMCMLPCRREKNENVKNLLQFFRGIQRAKKILLAQPSILSTSDKLDVRFFKRVCDTLCLIFSHCMTQSFYNHQKLFFANPRKLGNQQNCWFVPVIL